MALTTGTLRQQGDAPNSFTYLDDVGLVLEKGVAGRMVAMQDVIFLNHLRASLPHYLNRACHARQNAFLAGRQCASSALADAGFIGQSPLDRLDNGLVDWPDGWVGSISHSRELAICLVSRRHDHRLIGVDIEQMIGTETAYNIVHLIVESHELAAINELYDFQTSVTIIFSAKEALFKALYPATSKFENFDAASLLAASSTSLIFALAKDWGHGWVRGRHVMVRYRRFEDHIITWCLPPS